MNILITSIGNKTNLIKYFRRALFNEGSGRIIGIDIDPNNIGRLFVDKFLLSPATDDPSYGNWLKKNIKEWGISLIVPSRDGDLIRLAALKHELEEELDCHVMVNDRDTLEICLDKRKFYRWCATRLFPTAKMFSPEQISKKNLPIFVKPRNGSGSKDCLLISDFTQWQLWQTDHNFEDYVLQEYLDLPEYSIDVFCRVNGDIVSIVPRRREIIQDGESIRAKICLHAKLQNLVSALVSDLGLVGQNTIQCFVDKENCLVSEINPRFGGGFSLSVEAGADFPRYLIREVAHKEIRYSPHQLDASFTMVRIQKDVFYSQPPDPACNNAPEQSLDSKAAIYCFDLDGTICSESCIYEDAIPMHQIVVKINKLYDRGNTIIVSTTRGAASGRDWRKLIELQLNRWGVKYHRLETNKTYADVYVDNRSVNILDFV